MSITFARKPFFDAVREPVFRGAITSGQLGGTEAILAGWEHLQPDGDPRQLAYVLATANWETAHTMQPVPEYGHGRGHGYGAPAGPWHQAYYGRGDVQLTWLANYQKATTELRKRGVISSEDLCKTPDLALRPDIAAAVMFFGMIEGWFTGRKLRDYFGDASDWVGARRIINGTDHDADIAAIAKHFFAALQPAVVFTKAPAQQGPAPIASAAPPVSPSSTQPIAATIVKPGAPVVAPAKAAGKPGLFGWVTALFARH